MILYSASCELIERNLSEVYALLNSTHAWECRSIEALDTALTQIAHRLHAIRSEIAYNAVHPHTEKPSRSTSPLPPEWRKP